MYREQQRELRSLSDTIHRLAGVIEDLQLGSTAVAELQYNLDQRAEQLKASFETLETRVAGAEDRIDTVENYDWHAAEEAREYQGEDAVDSSAHPIQEFSTQPQMAGPATAVGARMTEELVRTIPQVSPDLRTQEYLVQQQYLIRNQSGTAALPSQPILAALM
jgi:hypothetical protein